MRTSGFVTSERQQRVDLKRSDPRSFSHRVVRNNEADYRAIIPQNVCLRESREVSHEFVPRVNESYSLLAIHRKWESANVRNVTRWRFAKLRTSRTAEFAVLGHTPGEGDRPLRRGSGRSIPARQLALSANSGRAGLGEIDRAPPIPAYGFDQRIAWYRLRPTGRERATGDKRPRRIRRRVAGRPGDDT